MEGWVNEPVLEIFSLQAHQNISTGKTSSKASVSIAILTFQKVFFFIPQFRGIEMIQILCRNKTCNVHRSFFENVDPIEAQQFSVSFSWMDQHPHSAIVDTVNYWVKMAWCMWRTGLKCMYYDVNERFYIVELLLMLLLLLLLLLLVVVVVVVQNRTIRG